RCPYCIDAHTLFLHGLGEHQGARWLAAASGSPPPESELAPIVGWAQAVRSPGAAVLREPPFGPAWAPEMVGTAVAFQYVTAMVTLFLGPTPIPRGLRFMRGTARRVLGGALGRRLARRPAPGLSLELLPAAVPGPELAWAAGSEPVAGAFARLGAAVDRCGRRVLSPEVRTLVTERLAAWTGEAPPLGRAWLDGELERAAGLPGRERARARLALLAALAPERATPQDLDLGDGSGAYRREVLEIAAWSAFATAARVASWMAGPYGSLPD
ncbi:MAG TPA: carboxymuconolactone decarboxylase family protein, partial [Thermoanaerobaculia bacterium]|nr:carboxymuconolactone decarboxylase family protein [Thermoanaerobaculia bacterium]